jgi:hypothetical protein
MTTTGAAGRVWARRTLGIAALIGLASLPSGPPRKRCPAITPSPTPLCPDPVTVDLQLVGAPSAVGYPVVGYTLGIDARRSYPRYSRD